MEERKNYKQKYSHLSRYMMNKNENLQGYKIINIKIYYNTKSITEQYHSLSMYYDVLLYSPAAFNLLCNNQFISNFDITSLILACIITFTCILISLIDQYQRNRKTISVNIQTDVLTISH